MTQPFYHKDILLLYNPTKIEYEEFNFNVVCYPALLFVY
jgi:hypothetical protein